jgi:hypothetical protein
MHYEELSLAVEPKSGGGYQIRALASPCGPGTAPFDLALSREEIEELIRDVGAIVTQPRGALGRDLVRGGPAPRPAADLDEIGARLFRLLFGGPVREVYLLSRGRIDSSPDRGLRLRIVLPVSSMEGGLLQAVPWEILRCEETREVLARSVRTPVVRILPIPWVSVPFPGPPPASVRILVVIAQPWGCAALDADHERERILDAWRGQPTAEVTTLRNCTLRSLAEALASGSYHAVHFIAHGTFDPESGVGSLLLESSDGSPFPVPGPVLGETLAAQRGLRAVFLNACRTSQVGSRPGQDALLGTAAALVRAGAPAVLAMQLPISDGGARDFSQTVYRCLARGGALDEAVAEGRLAMVQADPGSPEWVTPSLFAALSETEVFRPLCSRAEHRDVVREEALALLRALLGARDFERARQTAEAAIERASDTADFRYYLSLALLAGRRPRGLSVSALRPIEAAARGAVRCPDRAAHHLCFLAYLVRDFYLENHLAPPAADRGLLDTAAAAPRDAARLAELRELAPEAASDVASFESRQGRELP